MQKLKKVLGYGILVWAVPFVLSMVLFPLRESDRIFFETIMPVVVVAATVWAVRFIIFQRKSDVWQIGIAWFFLCVILDQAFFAWGPQKMSFTEYWKDIGFGYLTVPLIVWVAAIPLLKNELTTQAPRVQVVDTPVDESNLAT